MEKTSNSCLKIAIVGPESTGKSTLAERLANYYNEPWVPEVARSYVSSLKRPYLLNDIVLMAELQLKAEEDMMKKAKKFLFCDTTLLVHKIWADFVFQEIPDEISNKYIPQSYQLHLLCNIDLPWVYDPLREHPGHRVELFNKYENDLKTSKANYFVINGNAEQRLENAVHFINSNNIKS
jgi:nicotinamide riboside kinase